MPLVIQLTVLNLVHTEDMDEKAFAVISACCQNLYRFLFLFLSLVLGHNSFHLALLSSVLLVIRQIWYVYQVQI